MNLSKKLGILLAVFILLDVGLIYLFWNKSTEIIIIPKNNREVISINLEINIPDYVTNLTLVDNGSIDYKSFFRSNDESIINTKEINQEYFKELSNLINKGNFWSFDKEYRGHLAYPTPIYTITVESGHSELQDNNVQSIVCQDACPSEITNIINKIKNIWDEEDYKLGDTVLHTEKYKSEVIGIEFDYIDEWPLPRTWPLENKSFMHPSGNYALISTKSNPVLGKGSVIMRMQKNVFPETEFNGILVEYGHILGYENDEQGNYYLIKNDAHEGIIKQKISVNQLINSELGEFILLKDTELEATSTKEFLEIEDNANIAIANINHNGFTSLLVTDPAPLLDREWFVDMLKSFKGFEVDINVPQVDTKEITLKELPEDIRLSEMRAEIDLDEDYVFINSVLSHDKKKLAYMEFYKYTQSQLCGQSCPMKYRIKVKNLETGEIETVYEHGPQLYEGRLSFFQNALNKIISTAYAGSPVTGWNIHLPFGWTNDDRGLILKSIPGSLLVADNFYYSFRRYPLKDIKTVYVILDLKTKEIEDLAPSNAVFIDDGDVLVYLEVTKAYYPDPAAPGSAPVFGRVVLKKISDSQEIILEESDTVSYRIKEITENRKLILEGRVTTEYEYINEDTEFLEILEIDLP